MASNDTATAVLQAIESNSQPKISAALESLTLDPTQAAEIVSHLILLLDQDESYQDSVASILEDVGTPSIDQFQDLSKLTPRYEAGTMGADSAYWLITLMGRFQKEHSDQAHEEELNSLRPFLKAVDLHVQERAVWAVGCWGSHASSIVSDLKAIDCTEKPRLSRLVSLAIQAAE